MKKKTGTFSSKLMSVSLAFIMALSLAFSAVPGTVADYKGELVEAEGTEAESYSLPITIRDLHEEYMLYGVSGTITHRPMHVGDLYSSIRTVTENGITYRVPNYAEANDYEHVKYLTENFLNYACIMDTEKDAEHSQYFTQDFRAKLRQIITNNSISEAAWDIAAVNTTGKSFDDIRTANEAAVWLLDHLFIDGSFTLEGKKVEFSKTYPKYERLILDKRDKNVNGDEIECYGYNSCTVDKQEASTVFDTENKEIRNGESGIFQGDLGWFPLDKEVIGDTDFANLTFGYEAGEEKGHNYFTSTYGNGQFIYHEKDDLFFEFYGDDDVLLYINDRLAFDGGQLQNGALYSVWLEDEEANGKTLAENLGLEEGKVYNFDFYQMERCHSQSAFTIHTNINVQSPAAITKKLAYNSKGKLLDRYSVIEQNEDLIYEFVLTNNSAEGMDGVKNLTFEDALLDVNLTKDELDFGEYTTIEDITVKAPGSNSYVKVSEHQLKSLLKKGLEPQQSIHIKGFNYNSGNKACTIHNVVNTTALGKSMNSTDDYVIKGSAFMVLYVPAPAVVTIDADKFLDRHPASGGFEFILDGEDCAGNTVHQEIANDGEGNITFAPLSFNKEGVYTYTISEKGALTDDGILYDSNVYTAEVTVTLPEDHNEGYQAAVVYKKADGTTINDIQFANMTRTDATVDLVVSKELDGEKPGNNKFQFVLKDADGESIETVENDADGNVVFKTLTFNRAGIYTYSISEVKGTDGNFIYDETIYDIEIVVAISRDGTEYEVISQKVKENGVSYTGNVIEFDNYHRSPAVVKISGVKKLDGSAPADGQFEFLLKDTDNQVIGTASNDDNGNVVFDELSFDEPGTYTYTLAEVINAEDDAVIYDKAVYEVVIDVTIPENDNAKPYNYTVTYNKVGDTTDGESFEFLNKTRIPATVDLDVSKLFEGEIPEAELFWFELSGETLAEPQVRTTNKEGNVVFDTLVFDAANFNAKDSVYNYTIREVAGTDEDVIYDKSEYNVAITVTAPADSDSYETEVVYTKNGETVNNAAFENTTREHTSFALEASKTMDGEMPEEGKFSFTLASSENPEEILETVSNDAEGNIQFSAIEYDKAGVYTYVISEVVGEDETVVYDHDSYIAIVTVNAPEDDGAYKTSAEYAKASYQLGTVEPTEAAEFKNVTRESALVNIIASKTLDGENPEADQFTFELKDTDGNVVLTASNDADGTIMFDALEFNKSGIYTYTVSEVNSGDMDIVYDDSVYTIQIEVTADVTGLDAFQAELTFEKDGEIVDGISFANETVEPEPEDIPEQDEPDEPEEEDIPETDEPEEEDIPETDEPEEEDIPETNEPEEEDVVKTGDNASPMMIGLVSLLSLLVIAMVAMLKRRRFF